MNSLDPARYRSKHALAVLTLAEQRLIVEIRRLAPEVEETHQLRPIERDRIAMMLRASHRAGVRAQEVGHVD